ncbi:phospholysine phosphohistidine inorganic pyrophosphate phosphatase isoform X2 [Ailuropoda melanoleuca]|uniref:phospholysine phosphohistidine inorganic pyrophosphate phosphatase isoform X2 n=1 Tax=Ailuropoda melanoleuca TaxID=9646 RepID=UPI00149433DC|nr:phospholysine phosphohistidine inorganic pyrophosphate phosphatase isoform X2 [Ailuropoda melanoleuca]
MAAWDKRLAGVRGVLLDISGVLYDGGEDGGAPIPGSVEAVARLKRSRLKVRFCTNESQKSRRELVGLLRRQGFDISEGEVTAPAPAASLILKERSLRPHLLVCDDAGEDFSYQNMNKAFQVLMELEKPVLISLGKGRYYKETSGLMLDVGAYMKALEYACGIEAEVVGKPSPEYFQLALKEMGVEAHEVGWPLTGVCVCGSRSVGGGLEYGLEGSGSLWRRRGLDEDCGLPDSARLSAAGYTPLPRWSRGAFTLRVMVDGSQEQEDPRAFHQAPLESWCARPPSSCADRKPPPMN